MCFRSNRVDVKSQVKEKQIRMKQMMYDTCVCTLVHEKYSQATQILFREDILLFLTFCFCISTEIISLSQRKTKMKVFMVLFVQNQDLLAPL